MDLGYLMISAHVARTLTTTDAHFGQWFGESLQTHLRAIEKIEVPFGTQYRSEFQWGKKYQLGFITEYDKNGMPRTAVVYPTDGAY
jgi:hypothetical protein